MPVPPEATGSYVDDCIQTVALPAIAAGEAVLEVSIPFGRDTCVEAMYLLGDFGVTLQGPRATLTEPVRELAFGDITRQGLPFYGGNLTYHLPKPTGDGELAITHYRGAMTAVSVGGRRVGEIVFPPYRLALRDLPEDAGTLDVTLFGNRYNTFGPLHDFDAETLWWGGQAHKTERDAWAPEYNLRPMGILAAPRWRSL